MDFGFAAFLEKFEKFYGETASRILVGLLAVTTIGFCVSLLIGSVIAPLYGWIFGISQGHPTAFSIIFGGLVSIANIAIIVGGISTLRTSFRVKADLQATKDILREAEEANDAAKALLTKLQEGVAANL